MYHLNPGSWKDIPFSIAVWRIGRAREIRGRRIVRLSPVADFDDGTAYAAAWVADVDALDSAVGRGRLPTL